MVDKEQATNLFLKLIDIVERLRAPDGCPWDKEQTHESLLPYFLEETYEVIESVESKDWKTLKEELGDVLLHILLQAQIAKESNKFYRENLKAGQIISELDVKLLEVEKFLSGSYFTDISKVLGRKLKVSTKKHKILKERSLLPNWTLTKDQPIIIEAKNTSFSVYADGIALSNGFLGDLIKVRNTSSGLVIDAIVVSQKKVHPITNIDNN